MFNSVKRNDTTALFLVIAGNWNLEFKLILYTLPLWDDFYQLQETHFLESFAVNGVIN